MSKIKPAVTLGQHYSSEEMLVLGRIAQAQDYLGRATDWAAKARADRDQAIAELRTLGWTQREISTYTGLSLPTIVRIDRQQGVTSQRVTARPA